MNSPVIQGLNLNAPSYVKNARLIAWVADMVALTKPDSIYWCNGSQQEYDAMCSALVAEAPVEQRRMVGRTFTRWLTSKRGDEDIAPPDQELASTLGIPSKQNAAKANYKNAFTGLAKVGKFFWQQMTRIR